MYLSFDDLNREQLRELKERYLIEKEGSVSYDELIHIDEIVTDGQIREEYGHISFVPEDFWCGVRE